MCSQISVAATDHNQDSGPQEQELDGEMRGRAAGTLSNHTSDLLASVLLLQSRFEDDVSQTLSVVYDSADLYVESESLERLSVPEGIRGNGQSAF